ncbi:hypothetical protein H0H92_010197 [Tricholoma furcatifolium]|nr:hypothetical protein H0H92_010197 [Tricholoma furcatifolium]
MAQPLNARFDPIDPTARPNFVPPARTAATMQRAIYGESFAMSRTFNPRNIEAPWYMPWNQYLNELVGQNNRLLIFPQYVLWNDPKAPLKDDEKEPSEGGNSDDDNALPVVAAAADGVDIDKWRGSVRSGSPDSHVTPPADVVKHVDNRWPDPTDHFKQPGSDGIASTRASTTNDNGTRITDFAILMVTKPIEMQEFPDRYRGWRIQAPIGIPLLVELKRLCKRSENGILNRVLVTGKVTEARDEVTVQAALLFRSRKDIESVCVIAASGPYWSTATLMPVEPRIDDATFDKLLKRKSDEQTIRDCVAGRFTWTTIVRMGTPESDNLMKRICYEVLYAAATVG